MADPKRRICRTRDDAFAAGQEDARHDRPLSLGETARLAVLLRPYLTDQARKTA
jgi:hypothetical protein